jgi:hypothetical protein
LEGPPPQAVLTREQNKSLENQVFSLFGGVPYPPDFFPQKKGILFYFILSQAQKNIKIIFFLWIITLGNALKKYGLAFFFFFSFF